MLRIAFHSICVLLVLGSSALAQQADPDALKLTTELLKKFDPHAGSQRPAKIGAEALTEAEVLKLLPVAYRIVATPADSGNDWVIVCAEKTEFVFEFTDGKVSARSATFHPAVKTNILTPERFRQLKNGMTKQEVEKIFGEELSLARDWWSPSTENKPQPTETWRYVRGRELEIGLANGKVTGAHLKAYLDK